MKKARIILSAIALLSVIGGTLAFKAYRQGLGQLATYDPNQTILTSYTTDNKVYTATIPSCVLTNVFVRNNGQIVDTWKTSTAAAITTLGTAPDGSTTTFTFVFCTTTATAITGVN